jgi:hypothetical protein
MASRVEPLEQDIGLLIRRDLSPQAQSEVLAAFARETLGDAQEANQAALGHPSPHETFVDGLAGANEDSVRPNGTIVYEFDLILDLFAWIDDQLIQHSPVGSGSDPHPGLYKRSHLFFADDVEADPLTPPPGAAQYVFVNEQPYARKLETADAVYETVAAMAQRRYGNIAKIAFGWRSLANGAVGAYAASPSAIASASRHHREGKGAAEWLTRQPSIVITVR